VTLHDFNIEPVSEGNGDLLKMSILARTYRYNDTGDEQ